MPTVLFVHENFPAQFGSLALHLMKQGWDVLFATAAAHIPADGKTHVQAGGLRVVGYRRSREVGKDIHPYLRASELAVLNGQGFSRLAAALQKGGYTPDVVVAHSGWGSGSLVKVVWPETKFVQYLEWWYNYPGVDVPKYAVPANPEDKMASTLCRNLPFLLDAQSADAILVPTEHQAAQLPPMLRALSTVVHDGVNTSFYTPADASGSGPLANIPTNSPVLTFATRGMEPLRGFPQFMAAASVLQKQFPKLHVAIAGNDTVHYGPKLPDGDSYKTRALAKYAYDLERLHFVGHLKKDAYRDFLRRSTVHTYLTRPFVLSWSMIEAMATGCALVASDNEATREVATDGQTARLVDPDDLKALVATVADLLNDASQRETLSKAARAHVVSNYATETTYPKLETLLTDVIG